jgi:hypothetical protein
LVSLPYRCSKKARIAPPLIDVLERASDRERKVSDSYSLSLRADTGVLTALDSIGLGAVVKALVHTPVDSMFWAVSSGSGSNPSTTVLLRSTFDRDHVPWR